MYSKFYLVDLYFRSKSATKMADQFSRFLIDMKELLLDRVYVVNVLGTSSQEYTMSICINFFTSYFILLIMINFCQKLLYG